MKILYLIPARGGSKGLPGKNIKLLDGKPLIYYSIDVVREIANDEDICVSTDDLATIDTVKKYGLDVPFIRPDELSTDEATTFDVLIHAINQYKERGLFFEAIMLLQPTSPLREKRHLQDVISLYKDNPNADMVVSVKLSKDNPYFNLFEETTDGFLEKSKKSLFNRRQDCPDVYAYNGSIYLIKIESLLKSENLQFDRPVKYIMENIYSIDIDTPLDWLMTEIFLEKLKTAKSEK